LSLLPLFIVCCTVSKNPLRKEVKLLQKGIIKDDTSHVYSLPYENNTSHLLIQGYFSRFSRKERAALDFKMKKGTKVLAARDGVVIRVKRGWRQGRLEQKIQALREQYCDTAFRWVQGGLLSFAI